MYQGIIPLQNNILKPICYLSKNKFLKMFNLLKNHAEVFTKLQEKSRRRSFSGESICAEIQLFFFALRGTTRFL